MQQRTSARWYRASHGPWFMSHSILFKPWLKRYRMSHRPWYRVSQGPQHICGRLRAVWVRNMVVEVYLPHGKPPRWVKATSNQAKTFDKRQAGVVVEVGHWAITGRPGDWIIFSSTESYEIRGPEGPEPAFTDLSSAGGGAAPRAVDWSRGQAATFFSRWKQVFPRVNVEEYEKKVTAYVTDPRQARRDDVAHAAAVFGEIAFADCDLTGVGFWGRGGRRFANSNDDNYKNHRNSAMELFDKADRKLKSLAGH